MCRKRQLISPVNLLDYSMVEELACNNTLIRLRHHRADYGLSPVIMKGCTFNEAHCLKGLLLVNFTPDLKWNLCIVSIAKDAGKWSVFCDASVSTWLFLVYSAFTRAKWRPKWSIADTCRLVVTNFHFPDIRKRFARSVELLPILQPHFPILCSTRPYFTAQTH